MRPRPVPSQFARPSSTRRRLRAAGFALFLLTATAAPLLSSPALGAMAGEWLPPKIIDSGTLTAVSPSVAVESSGAAVVAWGQSDGTRLNLWASRYDANAGWGAPAMIEANDAGGVLEPKVAFGGLGNTFVVWEHSDGTRFSIWANHHSADWGWGNWGTPELLETDDTGSALNVQLASNGAGDLIAAWQQFDGAKNSIYANRYSAGSGWNGAELVENNDSANANAPQVAIAPNGDAVVLWAQTDFVTDHWASVYEAGLGWGNPAMIQQSSGPSNDTAGYAVASLPGGRAIAVWSQSSATSEDLWSNVYTPGTGWGAAQTIESNNTYAESPAIAVDALGNALCVWYQGTGLVGNVYANRYAAGSGWGTAEPVASPWNPSLGPMRVASSPAGDAVAVWTASSAGHPSAFANRYTPAVGWAPPELLERDDTHDADTPDVAVDAAGNAMVAWSQSDGIVPRIWADRFAAVDITAPTLSISAPPDGTVVDRSAIYVEGTVEPGAQISVNGVSAGVGPDGSWGLLAGLEPGPNTILVSAVDSAGNRMEATVRVHFDDPALGLADAVTQAQARVAALESQQASTLLDLARAQANLTAAQARVAAVEAEGNSTGADLAAAKADLSSAQRRVTSLEANATVAEAALARALGDLEAAEARVEALENQSNATQDSLADARAQAKAASGQAAFATILGEAGFLLAAAATFIAFMSRRVAQTEAKPKDPEPKEAPKDPDPKEAPKDPDPKEAPKDDEPKETPKAH